MKEVDLYSTLQFYANPDNYFAIGFFPDKPCGAFIDDFDMNYDKDIYDYNRPMPGKLARQVLKNNIFDNNFKIRSVDEYPLSGWDYYEICQLLNIPHNSDYFYKGNFPEFIYHDREEYLPKDWIYLKIYIHFVLGNFHINNNSRTVKRLCYILRKHLGKMIEFDTEPFKKIYYAAIKSNNYELLVFSESFCGHFWT